MHFLKKASIEDILQQSDQEKQFRTEIDLTSYYKEFELYLSHTSLRKYCGDRKDCYEMDAKSLDHKIREIAKNLQKGLMKNNAAISAIHVPESLYKTVGDMGRGREFSTNYLSLCEAVLCDKSYRILELCIKLADEINNSQYRGDARKENPIIVIVHAGCMKGCCPKEEDYRCIKDEPEAVERFIEKLNKLEIKTKVKIAVENVTPYYNDANGKPDQIAGENCGWRFGEEQKWLNRFLEELNNKIGPNKKTEESSNDKKEKNISFGLCIDFCHILASCSLINHLEPDSDHSEALCDAMDQYFSVFREMEQQGNIYLFHVSQYGENGEHGMLFQYVKDKKPVEKIRQLCHQYAPQAAITLEMKDGFDREKACKNFDDMMYLFSAMHTRGEFAELLAAKGNEELKEFLEDLFWIYVSDGKDPFKLSQKAWSVKAYIIKNIHHNADEELANEDTPFGFTLDEKTERAALFRLKAYIYYTRFCNLGVFLAEKYYKSFPFSEEHKADDFRLAMNYFMLNDGMEQCVYTGVAYKFNINFLPRIETFYRFNDGIEDCGVHKLNVSEDKKVFPQIAKMILDQINGSVKHLYSVGKYFGHCLFKYYDPGKREWTLRVYEDVPVNYIECKGRKYSIPAFLQIQETLDLKRESIGFAIDMSLFSKGRDGMKTSSLNGFFKYLIGQEISKERVGTIADGEIVLTQLPDYTNEYYISLPESMLLKKAYFDREKDSAKYIIDLDQARADKAAASQTMEISWEKILEIMEEMKAIEGSNQIEEIIEKVNKHARHDISREKNSMEELSRLPTYSCDKCNELFSIIRKYIKRKEEGAAKDEGQNK